VTAELLNKRAVALRYEQNAAAPRIVATGSGFVAQTIIDRAKEYEVPIAIEPELVELLVQLDLNQLIPPELYAAVAEVLAWAYQVDGMTAEDVRKQREAGQAEARSAGTKRR
jgi:flagellar biosynthesis protein